MNRRYCEFQDYYSYCKVIWAAAEQDIIHAGPDVARSNSTETDTVDTVAGSEAVAEALATTSAESGRLDFRIDGVPEFCESLQFFANQIRLA